MIFSWNTGETFSVPYFELRFECPCAVCVDEKTGKKVLKRENIAADIRARGVHTIGRYALKIEWSDNHSTGMYHFDRLFEICETQGKPVPS
jgi:ATP-binding protein involved in chromosome partitioning